MDQIEQALKHLEICYKPAGHGGRDSARKIRKRIRELEAREEKFAALLTACRHLQEGCQRQDERIREMQARAAEARRTGKPLGRGTPAPEVFDVGTVVDEILTALTALDGEKGDGKG